MESNEGMIPRRARPRRLPVAVREMPGKWVAVKDGEVVAARETPDQLLSELRRRGVRGARILRAPGEGDVELVGLG